MAISLRQLKNKWVASLAEGKIVGSVHSVYLDAEGRKLAGIQLKISRSSEERWVRSESVQKIGTDLIYISEEEVISASVPAGRCFDSLVGMPVMSKDGRALGTIMDIEVSSKSREISQLRIGPDQIIAVDQSEIIIGPDTILVQAQAKIQKHTLKPICQKIVYSNLREDLIRQTSQVIQRGEKFMKQTSAAFKRFLQGEKADLPQPGCSPQSRKKAVLKKKIRKHRNRQLSVHRSRTTKKATKAGRKKYTG